MNYKKLLLAAFALWLGILSQSYAQQRSRIINDSTKTIYGSKTTQTIREADIFRGNLTPTVIDTSTTNLPRVRYWYYDSTIYQDLGNVGTAAQPMFWRTPSTLGSRFGRNAFDIYSANPATLTYYDTKSPFTFLNYLQGALGEQIFHAKHTRNINARWNIGLGFDRVSAQKQIGSTNSGQNGYVSHSGFQAFSHYVTENGRYRIMGNFTTSKHTHVENGGIIPLVGDTVNALFNYKDQPIRTDQALSRENRSALHATQWLKLLGSGLQVYHTIDATTQINRYTDEALVYNSSTGALNFYPRVIYDSAQTQDRAKYSQLENTFGVMGTGSFFAYRAYVKRRDGKYELQTQRRDIEGGVVAEDTTVISEEMRARTIGENFIGGEIQLLPKNDIYVTGDGELQIGGGDYRFSAQARYKYLTIRQTRISYSPTLTQQSVLSNHYNWSNSFDNVNANQTTGRAEINVKNHYLAAQLQFTNINNYVYYSDTLSTGTTATWAEPTQASGAVNMVQGNLRYRVKLRSFVLDNDLYYTSVGGSDVIRMPKWYVNSRAYFQGWLFKQALYLTTGIEMTWHDKYFADAYMPVTQQFYLQNGFPVSQYPTFDVFLSADIKTVNLFLKFAHLNTVTSSWQPGYFTTPFYTANKLSFQFGVNWNFYD